MDRDEERTLRDLGRGAAYSTGRVSADSQRGLSRCIMTVSAVNGDGTLDLEMGSATHSMPLPGIRMTSACAGAKVGDRAVVDTYGHMSLAIGIVAS